MKENSIEETKKQLELILKVRKEQKEIIECAGGSCINCDPDIKALTESIDILSDYKRVLKENEEKNKIIDSMVKVMIDSSICDYFIKQKCKNYAGENGKICDNCIKQYFENKVKEVK